MKTTSLFKTENQYLLDRLALVGFYWYFVTVFWGSDGHHVATLLLFIYLAFWAVCYWDEWKKSNMAWLLIAGSIYIAARYTYGFFVSEDDFSWNTTYQWPFIKLSLIFPFVLLPFLVATNRISYLNRAFALLLIGLMVEITLELFFTENPKGLAHITSRRPGYGMGPITFGIMSGFMILGIMALNVRFRAAISRFSPSLSWLSPVLIAVAIFLLFGALIMTQSIGSWAGTIAAITTLLILWIHTGHSGDPSGSVRLQRLRIAALFLGIGIILVVANWELIDARLDSKGLDTSTLLATSPELIPEKVLGVRHDMYQSGLDSFMENPIFGILPGPVQENITANTSRSWVHVHNLPIQVLGSFGIVGFGLLATFVLVAIREMHRSYSEGTLPGDWVMLWYAALVFFLINSLFDLMIKNREIITLLSFLASIPVALQIARLQKERTDQKNIQNDPRSSNS